MIKNVSLRDLIHKDFHHPSHSSSLFLKKGNTSSIKRVRNTFINVLRHTCKNGYHHIQILNSDFFHLSINYTKNIYQRKDKVIRILNKKVKINYSHSSLPRLGM